MRWLVDHPLGLLVVDFAFFWLAAQAGLKLERRSAPLNDKEQGEYDIIRGAILAILGLLIGFSFSMAVSRYDLRKSLEESEANAIGTQYLRLDLVGPLGADAPALKATMRRYLDARIAFFTSASEAANEAEAQATGLQDDMWSPIAAAASAKPSPVAALAVAGMNAVIDAQGYTSAAFRNRLPVSAWSMMEIFAAVSCFLIGYGARGARPWMVAVVPFTAAMALSLVADMESPRGGFIRLKPDNLTSVARSLAPP